jgi:glycosyltransferase involved in cell wall biosynthesis
MKICFVINEFSFFISHRFDLLSEIAKKYDVTVITDMTFASKKDKHRCLKNNIQLRHLKQRSKRSKLSYLRFFFELRKKIYRSSYDHIFFVTIEMSLFGSLLKNRKCVRNKYYLVTGLGAFFFERKMKHRILKALYSIVFYQESKNSFSNFIFQNHSNKNLFISLNYAREKNSIVIKGNGIIPKNISKKISPMKKKLIKFCFAGNLTTSKGVQDLLNASENLFRENKKFELNIAGKYLSNESDYISLKYFKKIQESTYINFHGLIDHSEINNFYVNSDVFILPSHGEGLPKSALEAASNGLPLILTDVDGCNDCIDNNGYLVPAKNSLELAKKMAAFIANPEIIESMSDKSLSMIKEKFEISIITNKYLRLIERKT